MKLNAEFQRNLWQEISPQRLILTPLILGGLFFLFSLNPQPEKALMTAAIWVFMIATVLWGAHLAESSLAAEILGRTWTAQRLTSMSPWSMTWGKIFGSTLLPWYCGLLALLLLGSIAILNPYMDFKDTLPAGNLRDTLLLLVGLAVLAQSLGLFLGFASVEEDRQPARKRTGLGLLLAMFLAIYLVLIFADAVQREWLVSWYDRDYEAVSFLLISLYVFMGWTLVAATLQMRKELQVPNHPAVWLAFLIFFMVYTAGFFSTEDKNNWGLNDLYLVRLLLALFLASTWTYLSLFWERTRGTDVARLLRLYRDGHFQKALYEFPRWALSGMLAFAVGLALILYGSIVRPAVPPAQPFDLYGLAGASLFFMTRDIGLYLFFRFSAQPSRASVATVLALLVLYALLPAIAATLDLDSVLPLFLPSGAYSPLHSTLPPLVQTAVIGYFAVRRWRQRFSPQKAG